MSNIASIDRAIASMEPHALARAAMSLADKEDEAGKSNAIKDSFNYDAADPRAMAPPYSKDEFGSQQQKDPRLRKLLRIRARAVGGMGWELPSRENSEESPALATEAENRERDTLAKRIEEINPEAAFTEIAECVELDRAATGDGYLEIGRNFGESDNPTEKAMGMGAVRRIYHVPGPSVRILNDDSGFVQRRSTWTVERKVYFKRFGEAGILNKQTGKWADESLPGDLRASELIHFRNHDPASDYYGTPEFLAASNYLGLGLLSVMRLFNLIRNAPGWAFALKTTALHPQQWNDVMKDVDGANKGLFSAGGVLKLNLPRTPGMRAGQGDGSAMQTLGSWLGEAEPLLKVLDASREILREVFGFSEIFLGGSAALSRASAQTARQITNEMEIEPLIRRFEGTINATVMRSWNAKHVTFKVRRPKATDSSQESQIIARLGSLGILSVNQVVDQLNRLLPDANLRRSADPLCDVPIVILRETARDTGATSDSAKAVVASIASLTERLDRYAEEKRAA